MWNATNPRRGLKNGIKVLLLLLFFSFQGLCSLWTPTGLVSDGFLYAVPLTTSTFSVKTAINLSTMLACTFYPCYASIQHWYLFNCWSSFTGLSTFICVFIVNLVSHSEECSVLHKRVYCTMHEGKQSLEAIFWYRGVMCAGIDGDCVVPWRQAAYVTKNVICVCRHWGRSRGTMKASSSCVATLTAASPRGMQRCHTKPPVSWCLMVSVASSYPCCFSDICLLSVASFVGKGMGSVGQHFKTKVHQQLWSAAIQLLPILCW